jgi:hypothetical protein
MWHCSIKVAQFELEGSAEYELEGRMRIPLEPCRADFVQLGFLIGLPTPGPVTYIVMLVIGFASHVENFPVPLFLDFGSCAEPLCSWHCINSLVGAGAWDKGLCLVESIGLRFGGGAGEGGGGGHKWRRGGNAPQGFFFYIP